MDRKGFIKMLVTGGGIIAGGVVAVPALISALSPAWLRRPAVAWRPVGRLEDFPVGSVNPALVEVRREDWARSLRVKGVYVWREGEDEVVVFSRNCTDLSCPVVWDPGSEWFFCPCHGGVFSKNGERMAGPPKRALYRYANRVENGMVEIDLNSLPPIT